MICKEVYKHQVIFIIKIFIPSTDQIMGLSWCDPFIESSHLDVTDFGFYFQRERRQNLEEGQKLIKIQNFGGNFGLFQKSLTNKRKKLSRVES